MNDSVYAHKTTDAIERMQAMYDYSRNQEIAQQEREKSVAEKQKRQIILIVLLLFATITAFIFLKLIRERRKKQLLYTRNLEQLEQVQSEVLLLRVHEEEYIDIITKKEKMLEELRLEMQERKNKTLLNHTTIDKRIKESDIYQLLLKNQYRSKLSEKELCECRKLVIENLPEFNNLLLSKDYCLNAKDFNVCMLLRLGFKSKEVSNFLDITQGRVSQICSKVLLNVFKKDSGGATDLIEQLHLLY